MGIPLDADAIKMEVTRMAKAGMKKIMAQTTTTLTEELMISIIEESREDFSFLLKLQHLSPEQKSDIETAICAEGDSASYDCWDYMLVIPNNDFTTFDKMYDVIRGLMDKYNAKATCCQ